MLPFWSRCSLRRVRLSYITHSYQWSPYSYMQARKYATNNATDELLKVKDSEVRYFQAPVFAKRHSRVHTGYISYSESIDSTAENNTYLNYFVQRMSQTSLLPKKLSEQAYLDAQHLHIGVLSAMRGGFSPQDAARARVVCASFDESEFSAHGYPSIYQTLDRQADLLYIHGRTELERAPERHRLGWYFLSIAAELDHLDAALLLHRLERTNATFTAGQAREVIRYAKRQGIWEAIVADAEASNARHQWNLQLGRGIEDDLDIYAEISKRTRPGEFKSIQAKDVILRPPPGFLDLDMLETFEPPARYYWKLFRNSPHVHSSKEGSEDRWKNYTEMLQRDAEEYRNPEAMYELTRLPSESENDASSIGFEKYLKYMNIAAESGHTGACYNLFKHELCKQDLYPTKLMKWRAGETYSSKPIESLAYEQAYKQLDRFVSHATSTCLPREVGYIYLAKAGIESENGGHAQGRTTLIKGLEAIRACNDTTRTAKLQKQRFEQIFEQLHQRWEQYTPPKLDRPRDRDESVGLYKGVRPEDAITALNDIYKPISRC